jgi:hypothetical protein
LDAVGADGRIILKCILENKYKGMDSIHLTQDREQWQSIVNTVINSASTKGGGIS